MTYQIRFIDRNVLVHDFLPLKVEKEPGRAATMEACNAKPGLRAIIETDYIPAITPGERPIERVEEGLEQVPLYQLTKRTISKRDEQGRKVKVLRYGLLKGFAHVVGIETQGLEGKIYGEDTPNDFSPSEYDKIAVAVHSTLENAVRAGQLDPESLVTKNTIRYTWLRGSTTYFPHDWNVLGVLQVQCPEFASYYESFNNFDRAVITQSNDYYTSLGLETPTPNLFGAYLWFTGVRRVEARLATQPKGIPSTHLRRRPPKDTLFTYPEVTERLAKYFKERITREYSLGLILDVKKIPDTAIGKKHKVPDPNFARGVYVGRNLPEESDLTLIAPNKIYADYLILDYIFKSWNEVFVNAVARNMWGLRDAPIVRTTLKDELSNSVCVHSQGISDAISSTIRGFDHPTTEMYRSLKKGVAVAIQRGVPDDIASVTLGLYSRLMRKFDDVIRFLPHEFEELAYLMYRDNIKQGSREEKREKERRFKKLVDRVKTRFGIDINVSILELMYEGSAETYEEVLQQESDPRKKILSVLARERIIMELVQQVFVDRSKLLRYSEVEEHLRAMGLEEIIKFFNRGLYERFNLL